MKLSIIIPVFNEINCIEIFTNNLKMYSLMKMLNIYLLTMDLMMDLKNG